MEPESVTEKCWFVMRDLKRANARELAYQQLEKAGFEVFTPLEPKIVIRGKKRVKANVPVIHDMLFVKSTREQLDPIVVKTETLQYRYVKGGGYCEPLTVPRVEMERFIAIVNASSKVEYYRPEEITPAMIGSEVRIISDGPFNSLTGILAYRKGSRKKLIVRITDVIAAEVEISPDYIELLKPVD